MVTISNTNPDNILNPLTQDCAISLSQSAIPMPTWRDWGKAQEFSRTAGPYQLGYEQAQHIIGFLNCLALPLSCVLYSAW